MYWNIYFFLLELENSKEKLAAQLTHSDCELEATKNKLDALTSKLMVFLK